MKALKPKSKREFVLLYALFLSGLVSAYLMLRHQPLQVHMLALDEQFAKSNSNLSNAKPMRPGANNSAALRKEIEALKARVAEEKSTLAGFESSFIDLTRSDAEASMRRQITQLATENRVRILKISASSMDLTQLAEASKPGGNQAQSYALLKRRLFDITLRGDYYQLNDFITSFRQLPHAVVVTRFAFSIERERAPNALLLADFTLAF